MHGQMHVHAGCSRDYSFDDPFTEAVTACAPKPAAHSHVHYEQTRGGTPVFHPPHDRPMGRMTDRHRSRGRTASVPWRSRDVPVLRHRDRADSTPGPGARRPEPLVPADDRGVLPRCGTGHRIRRGAGVRSSPEPRAPEARTLLDTGPGSAPSGGSGGGTATGGAVPGGASATCRGTPSSGRRGPTVSATEARVPRHGGGRKGASGSLDHGAAPPAASPYRPRFTHAAPSGRGGPPW